MHTILIFAGGRQVDALLLSATPDRMRVAIPGRGDTVELSLVEGRWTSDRGLRVEIGALLVAEGVPVAHFLPRAHAHARALGAV